MKLETFIKNSLDKVPEKIKQKLKNIDFTIEDEYKEKPESRAACWKYGEMNKITFYRKRIEEDIQIGIDKLLVHELSHYFGFSEKKAQELQDQPQQPKKTARTKEQWAKWYNHKSNKERWIEAEERRQEELAESETIKEDIEN